MEHTNSSSIRSGGADGDTDTPALARHREHIPIIYRDLLVDVPVHHAAPLSTLLSRLPTAPDTRVASTPNTQVFFALFLQEYISTPPQHSSTALCWWILCPSSALM